jgi:pimeloyl-ACP methyl ester carboxylesterase
MTTRQAEQRVTYDDVGGSALLMLPGWGVNRGFFDPLAERLRKKSRVLTLDWRGHGASAAAHGYGHAELAQDAMAVIEAAGVQSVIPVGQAHGAWVALELRRRLGERVRGIVALSWLVLEPPPPFLGVLEALQNPKRWEAARDQLLAMWTTGAPAEVATRVRTEMGAYGEETWAAAGKSISAEYARWGFPLHAAEVLGPPPRFLHLYSQPKAPEFLAAQQAYAQKHPWFEVRRLEAVSHFPSLEVPEATAAEIEAFVAR